MKHKEKCILSTLVSLRFIEHFKERYPAYCVTCGGLGYYTYWEDVVGDGGPRMQMDEPCPDCIEKGICPLCGQLTVDEDGEKCSNCHWTFELGECCPEPHECYCYEDSWDDGEKPLDLPSVIDYVTDTQQER